MSGNQKNVDEVREIVRVRLAQLSRGVGEFRETYLMADDKFSGIRFEQGVFKALWKLDSSEVQVLRDQQQILLLSIESSDGTRRVA